MSPCLIFNVNIFSIEESTVEESSIFGGPPHHQEEYSIEPRLGTPNFSDQEQLLMAVLSANREGGLSAKVLYCSLVFLTTVEVDKFDQDPSKSSRCLC